MKYIDEFQLCHMFGMIRSDGWYQAFFTKKKKGKNKNWNAKNEMPIDKEKNRR